MSNYRKIVIGQKYGRLTPIEKIEKSERSKKNSYRLYRCRCDCGNIVDVPAPYIGRVKKSCGCLQREKRERPITPGTRVGKLVVIGKDPEGRIRNHYNLYICQCDCGNQILVRSDALRAETTRSCGCIKEELFIKNRPKKYWEETFVKGTSAMLIISNTPYKNNTSGHVGVSWHKTCKVWQARIQFQGKKYALGSYTDYDEAVKAREAAEQALHADFIAWYAENYPDRYKQFKKKENR